MIDEIMGLLDEVKRLHPEMAVRIHKIKTFLKESKIPLNDNERKMLEELCNSLSETDTSPEMVSVFEQLDKFISPF